MARKQRVNQAEIARKADVSIATVSMALRGHPSISKETRQRVEAIARKLGYRPDPALSALASYRGQHDVNLRGTVMGLLLPEGNRKLIQERPNLRAIVGGATESAERLGYRLELFFYSEKAKEQQQLSRILLNRGIRLLLVGPRAFQGPRKPLAFPWEQFATVSVVNRHHDDRLHCVQPDFFGNVRLALKNLAGRRIQSIGLCLGKGFIEWSEGAASSAHFHNFPFIQPAIREVPMMICDELKPEALLSWYDQHRPEVILTEGTTIYDILKAQGVEIPRSCGVVSLDTRQRSGLTGVNPQPRQTARSAVELLHSRALLFDFGLPKYPLHMNQPGRWMEGKTLDRKRG